MHISSTHLSLLAILPMTIYAATVQAAPNAQTRQATVQAAPNAQTRQMGASCSACHGTNGHSVGGTPMLAGLKRDHFIKQMQDFKSGARPATVMHRHARGYSDSEIEKLADYFAAQKRTP